MEEEVFKDIERWAGERGAQVSYFLSMTSLFASKAWPWREVAVDDLEVVAGGDFEELVEEIVE